jgi:spore coat protein U-like protein
MIAGLMWTTMSAAHAVITCSFNSTPNLNFGTYDPFSANPLDGATVLKVNCRTNRGSGEFLLLRVSLSTGAGTYAQRQLRDAFGNSLNYNLYTNAARTQVFGNGTGGTSIITQTANLTRTTQVLTMDVYGRIPAAQDPKVGSYSDTLIYTINF